MGRSGAGRLCSSKTLTSTFTRLTFTLMVPRGELGCGFFGLGDCASEGFACPDAEGCAHGGRSGFSWAASAKAHASKTSPGNSVDPLRPGGLVIYLLGCTFCARRCRWQFPVRPYRSVGEVLFLPDGHGALERIDGIAAGVEGGGTVRCADGDKHAGFANFHTPQPMHHGHPVNGVFVVKLPANLSHLGGGQ